MTGNRFAPCLLMVALVACRGDSFKPMPYEVGGGASVHITVPAGPHAPGAQVPLSVQSESNVEYVWNPCVRGLEGRQGAMWVPVNEGDRVCTAEGRILRPGRRSEATTEVSTSLSAGEYRFRYDFSRAAGEYNVSDYQVSNSFTISP
jgi:hypothetical protein